MTLKKDGFDRVTNAQANQTIHADMKAVNVRRDNLHVS